MTVQDLIFIGILLSATAVFALAQFIFNKFTQKNTATAHRVSRSTRKNQGLL
jgi:hypothetical protein